MQALFYSPNAEAAKGPNAQLAMCLLTYVLILHTELY